MSEATATGLYSRMDIAPGTLLAGRFRIDRLLGVGGMGVVYRAHDDALGIDVAVKLLRPEVAMRPDAFERFRQELLLARQVSSAHVVRIHDIARHEFAADDTRWLISMDLIEGQALDHRMEAGALPVDEAVRIARQIASGLEAAHARGVIHRDLKPANVLLDAQGNAYISDFGVARSLAGGSHSANGGMAGTPDYVSPEQARGDAVGPRSDLYALGLILYEMLSGERPFPGATAAEALAQRLVRTPPLLTRLRPETPTWLARLVERLLRPQAAHRPRDARSVAECLEQQRLPRDAVERRRIWLPVLAVTLALSLLALGVRLWAPDAPDGIVAPAPSPPLQRMLVLPIEGTRVPEADRVGLDMHLLATLGHRTATVDADRALQALRQLGGSSDDPDALREAAAASRVLHLKLEQAGAGWRVAAWLEGGPARVAWQGPTAGQPGHAVQAWLRDGRTQQHLALRDAALVLPPTEAIAALGSAEQARRAGRYGDAFTALQAHAGKHPQDAVAWRLLADVAGDIGEREAAAAAVEQARRTGAGRLSMHEMGALRAMYEGDVEAAVRQWRQHARTRPQDTLAQLQLARALGASGDHAAAMAQLRELTARDAQDARAWFELGKYTLLAGDARRAVEDYLLRALVLFKRGRMPYGEAETVNALGIGYARLGQTADAEEQYRRAVALRRAMGNRRGTATSLRNLANVLVQRGAFGEAEKLLEEARALYAALSDRAGLAGVDNERALLAEEQGDYRAALEAFRLALPGFELAGDGLGAADALNGAGFAHYQLGAYDEAQAYWLRAAERYRAIGTVSGQVRTMQNLGLLSAARGRWDDARARQEQALQLARKDQMVEETGVSHRNLAELALQRGDVAQGLDHAQRARAVFEQRNDPRGRVDAHLLQAQAHVLAGHAAPARAALADAEALLQGASAEQRAIAALLHAQLAGNDAAARARALAQAQSAATAAGVRALQLQVALERGFQPQLDAETRLLGHAGLRLHWLDGAIAHALQAGDADAGISHYREAAILAADIHTPVAIRIHRNGAALLQRGGDSAGAAEAGAAAAEAQARLRAALAASP